MYNFSLDNDERAMLKMAQPDYNVYYVHKRREKKMRYKIILLLFSLALSVGIVSAQDATPEATPETPAATAVITTEATSAATTEATTATTEATSAITATTAATSTATATTAATSETTAEATLPPVTAATIVNDEGGPVEITGKVAYTNGFFTEGVDEPEVILEDEAGFVDRNHGFVMPEKSQVLGQITSDFYTSPFDFNIELPIVPGATLRDVDHNGQTNTGVMIYAVAYWTNTWGDPYLEQRDLFGGGWSTAYASTHIDQNPSAHGEVIGGKYLVYAPDDQEGFPSGFGADKKLFTADDPIVTLPQGYTVVNMDTDPFTFDRSSHPEIDTIEGEGAAQEDFSSMSYTDAFKAMVDMFRKKYAYTELKNIDWDAKEAQYLPQFEAADQNKDSAAYQHALRDFIWSIPDGHLSAPVDNTEFSTATSGGLGMDIRELDDGSVIVDYLTDSGPAANAGIQLKAEIVSLNGKPIKDAVSATIPWSSPFSSDHVRLLQQLRYVMRSPIGTDFTVEYKNPGDSASKTATLTSVQENASFRYSSFSKGLTGLELPVQFTLLDSGYIKVNIYSFFDSARLTIQLWERMIKALNDNQVPGVIIDMRQNGGGIGFLADEMAAYFFDQPLDTGNTANYDDSLGTFYTDPNLESKFILPPANQRYHGNIAVLVGPSCDSACEYFSYAMTLQNRAAIVGEYPSAGLGGGQTTYLMPDGVQLQFSTGRNIDANGNINIEGKGVAPTVKVPVDETTLFSTGDPVLDAAVNWLNEQPVPTPSS